MKRNLFLACALMLSLFAVFACVSGGGGGGGGSSDPTVVISKLPPGGLKWQTRDSMLPILRQPLFDGTNFISLGENPTETLAGGVQIFADGFGQNEKHVYESLDGIDWEKTATVNAPEISAESSDMRSKLGTTYLRLGDDASSNYLERTGKGKWVEKKGDASDNPFLRRSGISYSFSSETDILRLTDKDSSGQLMTYEPDPDGFSLDKSLWGDAFFGPNRELLRLRRTVKNTGDSTWAKPLLYHAPNGDPNLKLVNNFPNLKEFTKNPNKALFADLTVAYGKGLYIVGLGNKMAPGPQGTPNANDFALRFYTSTDLNSWTQVQGLPDFSKSSTDKAGTTVYELGYIDYWKGLFVIFIREGTYSGGSFTQTACHVLTSTDMKTFGQQRLTNVDCKYSSVSYVKGRFLLPAKKEIGKRGHINGATVYRYVMLAVPYP